MIRLDEGDSLVSGHTLCRHQAIFLESWTDRVVARHTHVRYQWRIFNFLSKLFQGLCMHDPSVFAGDGVGFSKLTKRSETSFTRKMDQIGHLRNALCEL